MAPGPTPTLTMEAPGVYQVTGALRGHHVARRQRQAQVERRHRLDRVQHLDLMAVRGVDNEQVDARLGQRTGLGADVAVDADRRRDPQPAAGIDGGGVDPGPDRAGTGQHAGQDAVRVGHHRHVDRGMFEQVKDLSRVGAHGGGDEIGDRDVAHPGETVHAEAVGLGDQTDRPALENHHRGAVRTFVDQRGRVGHRIVGEERHRGVDDEVAALDEVDGLRDR